MVDELSTIFREFVLLMDNGFRCYEELRVRFLKNLPEYAGPNPSKSLESDLSKYLFSDAFCNAIPEHLKTVRRLLIRLEDYHSTEEELLAIILKPSELKAIAERLETLFQQNWETHRYQVHHQPIQLLMEAQHISETWNRCLTAFNTANTVVEALESPASPPLPKNTQTLEIRYYPEPPAPLNTQPLTALLHFLHSSHQFISSAIGGEQLPLIILGIRTGEPLAIKLAIPQHTATEYLRFLQHLFLKDMLKQEALLKVVFQSVIKEHQTARQLTPQQLKTQEKSLLIALKDLPSPAKFEISGRKFPQDNILVLKQLTDFLTERNIAFKNLLAEPRTSRPTSKSSNNSVQSKSPPPALAIPSTPPPAPAAPAAPSPPDDPNSQPSHPERISILTAK